MRQMPVLWYSLQMYGHVETEKVDTAWEFVNKSSKDFVRDNLGENKKTKEDTNK